MRSDVKLPCRSRSASDVQRALPARVSKEMKRHVRNPGYVVANAGFVVLVLGGDEGPVVEERPADDVLAWDEAPVAGIEAVVTIVAHHEELACGDDEIAVDNVTCKFIGPRVWYASIRIAVSFRGDGRKFVVERHVVGGSCGLCVRLRQFLAVDIDDAVVEMEVIAGNSDEALDEEEDCGLALSIDGAG